MRDVRDRSRLKYVSGILIAVLCLCVVAGIIHLCTRVNIWTAVEREDLAAIQQYADNGGDLETGAYVWAKTPLFHALKLHKKKSYKKLLEVGANPNTLCRRGNVVIHYAAAEQDSYWLEVAIGSGADPSLFNSNGYGWIKTTPIVFAVNAGRLDNVKLLCEHGADINASDPQGRTPLTNASEYGQFEIVYYLLEKGADFNKPARKTFTFIFSLQGMRPEHCRNLPSNQQKWYRAVLDWMIAHGADPNKATWDGTKWVFGQKGGNDEGEKR